MQVDKGSEDTQTVTEKINAYYVSILENFKVGDLFVRGLWFKSRGEFREAYKQCMTPPGGGGTPYGELYCDAPAERGPGFFFRLEVDKPVLILRGEIQ